LQCLYTYTRHVPFGGKVVVVSGELVVVVVVTGRVNVVFRVEPFVVSIISTDKRLAVAVDNVDKGFVVVVVAAAAAAVVVVVVNVVGVIAAVVVDGVVGVVVVGIVAGVVIVGIFVAAVGPVVSFVDVAFAVVVIVLGEIVVAIDVECNVVVVEFVDSDCVEEGIDGSDVVVLCRCVVLTVLIVVAFVTRVLVVGLPDGCGVVDSVVDSFIVGDALADVVVVDGITVVVTETQTFIMKKVKCMECIA